MASQIHHCLPQSNSPRCVWGNTVKFTVRKCPSRIVATRPTTNWPLLALWPHPLPLSPAVTLLQILASLLLLKPFRHMSDLGPLSGCSLSLEHTFSRYPHQWLPHLFPALVQMSPFQGDLQWPVFLKMASCPSPPCIPVLPIPFPWPLFFEYSKIFY